MTNSQQLQTYLESALQDGLAELSGEGRTERIRLADHDLLNALPETGGELLEAR